MTDQDNGKCLATVVGYDVCGFTKILDQAVADVGEDAAETIAALLKQGQESLSAILGEHDFQFAETTGDGAIYTRLETREPSISEQDSLSRLLSQVAEHYFDTSQLPIRCAFSTGLIQMFDLPDYVSEKRCLHLGRAVTEVHTAMNLSRKIRADPSISRQDWRKLPSFADALGGIAQEYCIFIRLLAEEDWPDATAERIIAPTKMIHEWADPLGGQVCAVTHDEKGVHVRLSFPLHSIDETDLRNGIALVANRLKQSGYNGSTGLDRGTVFRGGMGSGSVFVHGSCINRAAKACMTNASDETDMSPTRKPAPVVANDLRDVGLFVGREHDLANMHAWISGKGASAMVVRGPAGIGKSALVQAAVTADLRSHSWLAQVRCGSTSALTPFYTVIAISEQLVGHALSSGAIDDLDVWASRVLVAAGLDEQYRFLFRILLPHSNLQLGGADDIEIGNRLDAVSRLALAIFSDLCSRRRLVMLVDDAHLLDRDSIELFSRLDLDRPAVRLLLVARNETVPDPLALIVERQNVRSIMLAELPKSELRRLIRQHFDLDAADLESCADIAGGNPLLAIQAGSAFSAGTASPGNLPMDILSMRLAALNDQAHLALRIVCLGGGGVSSDMIRAVFMRIGGSPLTETILSALSREHLIRSLDNDPDALEPYHDLVGEAVLKTVPRGSRVLVCRTLGHFLQSNAVEAASRSRRLGQLSGLWLSAEMPVRAAICLAASARLAWKDGFFRAAMDQFDRGVEILESNGQRQSHFCIALLADLAEVAWAQGEIEKAGDAAAKVVSLHDKKRADWPSVAVRMATIMSETAHFTGRLDIMFRAHVQIVRHGLTADITTMAKGRSLSTLAYSFALLRCHGIARRMTSHAIELSRQAGDGRPAAYSLTAAALSHYVFARWSEGDQALSAARHHLAHRPQEFQLNEVIETTAGIAAHLQGQFDRAQQHFEILRQSATKRRHRLHCGWADYAEAATLLAMERYGEGGDLLSRGMERVWGTGDKQSEHICIGLDARFAWELGRTDVALKRAEEAGRLSRMQRPTNYSSLEAYSAAPLVGVLCQLAGGSLEAPGKRLQRRYLPALRKYALVFPLARPRLMLVRGIVESIAGTPRAPAMLDQARLMARKFKMAGEVRLIERTSSLAGFDLPAIERKAS